MSASPSSYKIPTVADVPLDLRISLLTGADPSRPASACYSSRGVGEPAVILGASGVLCAVRHAVAARRREMVRGSRSNKYYYLGPWVCLSTEGEAFIVSFY